MTGGSVVLAGSRPAVSRLPGPTGDRSHPASEHRPREAQRDEGGVRIDDEPTDQDRQDRTELRPRGGERNDGREDEQVGGPS